MLIAAIVLAAGASRRMGSPKALLPIGGSTFVARVCRTLREGGVARVVVVTRADLAAAVREAVGPDAVVAVNQHPDNGMLSSIHVGLAAVGDADAVLLAMVDHPLVRPDTVRDLIARHAADPHRIILPVRAGRRGHPVLFPAACFDELRAAPADQGARAVVWRDAARVLEVPVDDAGPFTDLNRPEDCRRALPPV